MSLKNFQTTGMKTEYGGCVLTTASRPKRAVAEDEAGAASHETVMNVPHGLVSKVRELIAKRHS